MERQIILSKPIKMRVAVNGGTMQYIEAQIKELREIADKYNCDIQIDITVRDDYKSYKELIKENKEWI